MSANGETPGAADEAAVLEALARWQSEGAALATVIETWGSSPRPVGSQLAVSGAGRFVGSVSGGCVEGAVVSLAKEAIETHAPRLIEFGVTDTEAWALGLACGGRVAIYIEPAGGPGLAASTVGRLLEAQRGERPVARVVDLLSGAESLIEPGGQASGAPLGEAVRAAALTALEEDRPGLVPGTKSFVRPHLPAPRLIIVGATHIAQSLAPMAALAGYGVVIVDPRRAFATPERFPGVALLIEWPEPAFARLKPDQRSAVVTLAHDPKVDDVALALALESPAFYIGALGSRSNQAKRLERLKAAGVPEAELARIHGPIGLAIGALSPAEIAIAILAQITKVRRRPREP